MGVWHTPCLDTGWSVSLSVPKGRYDGKTADDLLNTFFQDTTSTNLRKPLRRRDHAMGKPAVRTVHDIVVTFCSY